MHTSEYPLKSRKPRELKRPKQTPLKAFVAHGVHVQEWYQEQESTLNPERPKFQRLLEQVESGEVTTIVVAALDRFSRDQIETLRLLNS